MPNNAILHNKIKTGINPVFINKPFFIRQMENKLLVMIMMLGEIVLLNTCKMMGLMV